MSLNPKSYAEALERKRNRPVKPRKPLNRTSSLKASGKRLTSRKRMSKRSKKKISKDKVWKEFSIFIRTRGADSEGYVVCVTCGAQKYWKEMQAGHFIAGRLNSNLFDERGCQVQCYSCNVGKHGNTVMYYRWMATRYGEEVINELILQNNQTVKWPKGHLDELYQKYSALNQQNPLTQVAEL